MTAARCRRCGRTLTAPAGVLSGYGPRCAGLYLETLQAEQAAMPAVVDGVLSAVALVTAEVQRVDVGLADLVEDADVAGVVRTLVTMVARLLLIRAEPPEAPLRRLAEYAVQRHSAGGDR